MLYFLEILILFKKKERIFVLDIAWREQSFEHLNENIFELNTISRERSLGYLIEIHFDNILYFILSKILKRFYPKKKFLSKTQKDSIYKKKSLSLFFFK